MGLAEGETRNMPHHATRKSTHSFIRLTRIPLTRAEEKREEHPDFALQSYAATATGAFPGWMLEADDRGKGNKRVTEGEVGPGSQLPQQPCPGMDPEESEKRALNVALWVVSKAFF